jgi:hypothetical protein
MQPNFNLSALRAQDISHLTGLQIAARRRDMRICFCAAVGRLAFSLARHRDAASDLDNLQWRYEELLAFQIAIATNPPTKKEGTR